MGSLSSLVMTSYRLLIVTIDLSLGVSQWSDLSRTDIRTDGQMVWHKAALCIGLVVKK